MNSDLVKFLAPYGLVVCGLVAAGLGLPEVAWGGCIISGLALINPGPKSPNPPSQQGSNP